MDEEARRVAAATGITPLEYMLSVMRDPEVRTERRDAMAIAAAPYMHAKLAQLKHLGDPNNPVREIHRIERVIYDAKTGEALAEIDGQLRPAPADHVQNIQTIEGEAEEIPDIEREAAD